MKNIIVFPLMILVLTISSGCQENNGTKSDTMLLPQKTDYSDELLKNGDFSLGAEYWGLAPNAEIINGAAIVNVSEPVTQAISVQGLGVYRLSVKAKCYDEIGNGRLQVNWLDSSEFISASIEVFECTNQMTDYSIEFTSPQDTQAAVVYATGHDQSLIIFDELSFRRKM